MKKIILLLLISFGLSFATEATTSPKSSLPSFLISRFVSMKAKDVEKMTGKKMTLKEKIAFGIMKHKWKKELQRKSGKPAGSGLGQTAMILGIVGLACLLIPYVGIVSLPLAILAIVFGKQALRANPDDRKAKTGVILGWVTIGLFILALIIVLAVISSWGWGWG